MLAGRVRSLRAGGAPEVEGIDDGRTGGGRASGGLRRVAPWMGAAVAAAALAVISVPRGDGLVERGGAPSTLSFSAYVVEEGGAIRQHQPQRPVLARDYLKLRASWGPKSDPGALKALVAAFVPWRGPASITELPLPPRSEGAVSVPGAIGLGGFPPGPLVLYVIAGRDKLDPALLRQAVERRLPAREVSQALGTALAIERIDLEISAEGGSGAKP
jgi:hypothetical protein